jgi:polysaccharide deacetylase 2 family uncharacterized protein YibQ
LEDSQENPPVDKPPVSKLLLTSLILSLVLAAVIFFGWKGSDSLQDVAKSSVTDTASSVDGTQGKNISSVEPGEAVDKADISQSAILSDDKADISQSAILSDDKADISQSATPSDDKVVADVVSAEGVLAAEESLGARTSLLVTPGIDGEQNSSLSATTSLAIDSAISSTVESASVSISSVGTASAENPSEVVDNKPIDSAIKLVESAGDGGLGIAGDKASLKISAITNDEGSSPSNVSKSGLATRIETKIVPPAEPVLSKPVSEPASSEGSIVYEEHFVDEIHYPTPTPSMVTPKRNLHKREKSKIRLAVIIDDLGYNSRVSKAIARLPADITLAVLPGGIASQDVVNIATQTGKELILHQPMQPLGYPAVNPGPNALLGGMGQEKLRRVLLDNLAKFSTAVGINNHMGSFLTTQVTAMDVVMEVLAERKLFFVDSRTSVKTIAESRARLSGIPVARRDVFIDNNQDKASILKQLSLLESLAYNGPVVGIGHPYPGTLAALKEWIPALKAKGIVLARVSQLLSPESARSLYPDVSSGVSE